MWPDFFCVGIGEKGSGYPSIEILCDRIARNWWVLTSTDELVCGLAMRENVASYTMSEPQSDFTHYIDSW